MIAPSPLAQEKIWVDKAVYDLAEMRFYERLAKRQVCSSSTPNKERINEESKTSPKQCFIGFEKDGASKFKSPEKVWVSKHIYDLAEKEYYEKIEKSRLVSLGKAHKLQDKVVNEKLGEIEVAGKESDSTDALSLETKANESPLIDKQHAKKKFQYVETKDNITESQIHNNSGTLENVNVDSEEVLNDTSFTELSPSDKSPSMKLNEKKKSIAPISSPRMKMNLVDDKILKTEVIDPESKKRLRLDEPQEFKENPKPQKIRLTEEKYLCDSGKEKRKPSDEKKSQDNLAKLPKGAQNPNKKSNSNSSPPKNKSTNVNTIPTFTKMTTINGLNPKSNKGNEIDKNSDTVQKFEIGPKVNESPVINESISTANTDETQTKKETKKNKKNKKRHRDEKGVSQNGNTWNSLAGEVAKARQHIKNSLQCIDDIASITSSNVVIEVNNRINSLEKENSEMKQKVKELTDLLAKFEQRLACIEKGSPSVTNSKPSTANVSSQSIKPQTTTSSSQSSKPSTATVSSQATKPTTANVSSQSSKPVVCDDDEDDGVDLFASESEEEDNEAAKIKEQRLAEYAAKKSKKPTVIAKSSIVLDVKPWDDTTDMKVMEKEVRKITADGLLWGASKLVPLAYGIHKLQISCVVEDDKVSVDWLQETIETIEDFVQSVDIAAFNKI